MQITINCECGETYTVDETPVNGHLCFPVACPHCRRDGTHKANEFIRRAENGESTETAGGRRLRKAGAGFRFGAGVAGALVGGFAGMMIWYFIAKTTHLEFGIVAWVVGALVGAGARLAMPSGSFGLAGFAALFAFCAILGGQYLTMRHVINNGIQRGTDNLYDKLQLYAQKAVQAKSDAEIARLLRGNALSPRDLGPGENTLLSEKFWLPLFEVVFHDFMKPGTSIGLTERIEQVRARTEPTAADIAAFRQREVPDFKAFIAGKPSKEEFTGALQKMVWKNISLNTMLIQCWTPLQLLWFFLGIGSAWRIAYNRSETESC